MQNQDEGDDSTYSVYVVVIEDYGLADADLAEVTLARRRIDEGMSFSTARDVIDDIQEEWYA